MALAELPDPDACYLAAAGRDPRYDGRVFLAVITTGIYCRPSCPSPKPQQRNCRFYPTAAAAVAAGFRACKRCRPDALPGSRQWNTRGDLAGRATRLIREGAVDEVGVGPQQLNRTRLAQTARMLIEQTRLPLAEVAFAAGFASVRQFNDVIHEEFAAPPSALRRGRSYRDGAPDEVGAGPAVVLRLRHRTPLAMAPLRRFLRTHSIAGVDRHDPAAAEHTRVVPAPHGPAVVTVGLADDAADDHVVARLRLADIADLGSVVARTRRWLDLDADPAAIDEALGCDPELAPLVTQRPGLRVPGAVDGVETALLAVLGQQVSWRPRAPSPVGS